MENEHNEHTEPHVPPAEADTVSAPAGTPKDGNIGPVIGIIIIVALLLVGGVYYFTVGINQVQNGSSEEVGVEDEAAALLEQSASTELGAIEADLDATDLSGLEDAAADFESELQVQ